MEGQVGSGLLQHPDHTQVLHDQRIHPHIAGLGGQLGGQRQFPVGQQRVQGQVDLYPPQVTIRNRLSSLLRREIFGVSAGVERSISEIDRIGAVLHGGLHRFHGAGGG